MTTNSLHSLATKYRNFSISDSFLHSTNRFEQYAVTAEDLFMDYSKQHVNDEIIDGLINFATERELIKHRSAMFSGEVINHTEGRSVLHSILRAPKSEQVKVLGEAIASEVAQCEQQMASLVEQLHDGLLKGYSDKSITDVIAVGIGGSYYGPKVCAQALKSYASNKVKVHYLANVDGCAVDEKLAKLNAETTLIVVISKTFVTTETLLNATVLKEWLASSGCASGDFDKHFVAVTADKTRAISFGICESRILPMWDWVGGRFSLWSAVGFPLACAIGIDNFRQLKAGAFEMDQHFQSAPLKQNMPVMMGLLGVWNRSFLKYPSLAVLPYDHRLRDIPGYLQQVDMESNGKCVDHWGQSTELDTAPIVFGQEGTNSQHAFMQMMHQSNEVIPSEFIVAMKSSSLHKQHHKTMVANCFAQSEALMKGKSLTQVTEELISGGLNLEQAKELAPHKVMCGNNPSLTLVMDELTPKSLGSLMALYEHKIFVQGVMWQLNSFDQWGVELGKELGKTVLDVFDGVDTNELSPSSIGLIERFKNSIQ